MIDIKNETILLDKSLDTLNVDLVSSEIPADKGRFHLYRYKHTHENESYNSIVFLYSMPGFVCTVKERMLYSSCKTPFISFLKSQIGLEVSKTIETGEPEEITQNYILDEIHPKKLTDNLKFSKPKGPSSRGPRRVTRPTE